MRRKKKAVVGAAPAEACYLTFLRHARLQIGPNLAGRRNALTGYLPGSSWWALDMWLAMCGGRRAEAEQPKRETAQTSFCERWVPARPTRAEPVMVILQSLSLADRYNMWTIMEALGSHVKE